MTRRIAAAVLCVVIFGVGSATALADNFSFSFSGAASGSGVLTANASGTPGEFDIVGISGVTNGSAISGLLPVNDFFGNDNLLFYPDPGTGYLDVDGVSYSLMNGNDVNLYGGGVYTFEESSVGGGQLTSLTVTSAAPTPEPASFLMLGTGMLGVAGVVRRRLAV